MAKNLRSKISDSDSLILHDVNREATKSFMAELGSSTNTQVADNVRQVAEQAVS